MRNRNLRFHKFESANLLTNTVGVCKNGTFLTKKFQSEDHRGMFAKFKLVVRNGLRAAKPKLESAWKRYLTPMLH